MPDSNEIKKKLKQAVSTTLSTLGATAKFAGNVLGQQTGYSFLETHDEASIEKFHSPDAHAKILQEYAPSVKTTFLLAPLKDATQAVHTHLASLIPSSPFEAEKQRLQELIDDEVDLKANQEKLQNIETLERQLAISPDLTLYEQRFDNLQELLEADDLDNPRAIAAYVNDQYQMMMQELAHAAEEAPKRLKEQYDAAKLAGFKPEIPLATQMDNLNKAYTAAKENLEIAFQKGKAAHKVGEEEIKAQMSFAQRFKQATAQAEQDLINLVLFSKINPKLPLPQQALEMRAGTIENDPRKYRNIQFTDYKNGRELTTPGGLSLRNDGNGSILVTIPSFGWSPFHHYVDNRLADTLLFIANQIKAEGKESITWTINIKDPALRQKIMEEAYYTAKLAGFSDDKIIFEVTAKPTEEDKDAGIDHKTAKEIQSRLGHAPQRAATTLKEWEARQKAINDSNHSNLRTEVDKLAERVDDLHSQHMELKSSKFSP